MTAKKRSRKSAGAKKAKSGQAESNQASTQAKQENGQPGRRKAQLVQTRLQLGKRSQQASQQVQVRSKQQAQVQSRQSRQQAQVQSRQQADAQTQTEQRAPREAFPGLGAVVQQNMSALEAAVRQGSAAALELEQALEARDGVSPLVQFLFGHAQQPHAQCESCFEFAGHVCTEASGAALARKVGLETVRGRFVCLACF
jgi:hypothetical protein